MSPRDARILSLLEAILDDEVSPEDACREEPELLAEVRQRLDQVRALDAQIDTVLPSTDATSGRRSARDLSAKLPRIDGYQVERVIGSGGMGVVYRARHERLNRMVAMKMLLSGGYAGQIELERFKREAEAIAAIGHPNIVQVYDAGECDGHPYYVMELVEGGTLAQQLDGRPRPARESVATVVTLARAVHAAHRGGVMHRDLKPANILVASDATLKIADFGLARRLGQPDHASTLVGVHMGTPSYMAPEQAAGEATGFCPLIDIYALGAILYELLTGRPPFRGESVAATLRQVIGDDPVPPMRLSPTVPRDVQTICLKCLHKDPSRRYASAMDLAEDLHRFARGEAIHARPVGAVERAVKWCRRRPGLATAIAASLVITVAAISGGVWLQRVQQARATEQAIRTQGARSEIEVALPLIERLMRARQWDEGQGVIREARARLGDAASPELAARVDTAADEFDTARELDQIRLRIPEPATSGYTFFPARDSYAAVFERLGIGAGVDPQTAAARVRESPLRDVILTAMDHAAFTELFSASDEERRRLLAVARQAQPDPWQDRFHDADAWRDEPSLRALVRDAPAAKPPTHQLVIVGVLLSNLGSSDATVHILQDAQIRDPGDFWVNLELGNVFKRMGRLPDAIQFYRAAVAIRPTHNVAWATLGSTLSRAGQDAEAIAPLRKAIQLEPTYPQSWQLLMIALANCDRWDEAQDVSRAARDAIPNEPAIAGSSDWLQLRHARAAAARGDWTVAVASYRPAVQGLYDRNAEAWFEQAATSLLAGDTNAYQDACEAMVSRRDELDLRHFLVARTCTLAQVPASRLADAARIGATEIDQFPDAGWALTVKGALAFRGGDARGAIAIFEESLARDARPENAVINWVWLARAHLDLGDHAAARAWLTKATRWLDQGEGGGVNGGGNGEWTHRTKPAEVHLHNWLEAAILRAEVERSLSVSGEPASTGRTPE